MTASSRAGRHLQCVPRCRQASTNSALNQHGRYALSGVGPTDTGRPNEYGTIVPSARNFWPGCERRGISIDSSPKQDVAGPLQDVRALPSEKSRGTVGRLRSSGLRSVRQWRWEPIN